MPRVPITVMGFHCERCGHEWVPRGENEVEPKTCAKCRSPYWDRPRKLSYETFRDRIEKTLREAQGKLTWTEIRTTAKLPQAFPNNQWVHRLEQDIGLQRQRDTHGIIHWMLGSAANGQKQ